MVLVCLGSRSEPCDQILASVHHHRPDTHTSTSPTSHGLQRAMALDSILRAQEQDVRRDEEIARILKCHHKDHFDILQINPLQDDLESVLPNLLRKAYRKKSLLIHPDKSQNALAPQAFDLLKKAELVLAKDPPDDVEKSDLLSVYCEVRILMAVEAPTEHGHEINAGIRQKVRSVLESHLKDQQVEKDYSQRQEAQKQSEIQTAARERELKRSWESRWASDRDERVKLWRDYTSKVEKKTRKKKRVLI